MKTYIAAFLLVSQSAFALTELSEPLHVLEEILLNNSKASLVGKNLKSGKECLFQIEKFENLGRISYDNVIISADAKNFQEKVRSYILYNDDVKSNNANVLKAVTGSSYPRALTERDVTDISRKGDLLVVKMKHIKGLLGEGKSQDVSCKFDLRQVPTDKPTCENQDVRKTVAVCKLNKNIGNNEVAFLDAEVKLQLREVHTCFNDKIVKSVDGYLVKSSLYSYSNYRSDESSKLLDVNGRTESSVGDIISGRSFESSGNSVEKTFSYDKKTKKLVLKYTYVPDFSLVRKTYYNAELNCKPVL